MPNGQSAYEGYVSQRKGKAHDGKPLPTWAEVSPENQAAWDAFADAARRNVPPDDAYTKVYLDKTKGMTVDGRPAPAFLFFHYNAPEIEEAWRKAWEAARK